ncbi:MAG: hypothetical protein HY301_09815 [Verrucomicrobia bacterium]|nr:hypothetical protein [Verrucomicrobiota bacterium]
MPNPPILRWNSPGARWNDGSVWGGSASPPENLVLPGQPITLNSPTNMEFWQVTKERAEITLPIWVQYAPTTKIGTKGTTDLSGYIDQFEPLMQQRTDAQDDFDAAYRAVQSSLLKMKVLGTKIPAIIEAQLEENEGIMADVNDLYATSPRAEGTILKRARDLYPVWVRANTALAALTPAQPAITRLIGGVPHTAVMLKALLDGYTDLVKTMHDKAEALEVKRAALRELDRATDQLSKRWYRLAKNTFEPDSAAYAALDAIPTEPGTAAPETVEINTVVQGGDGGLQVLVNYVPGGGDHATTKLVKWQVVGTDATFAHSAPLDASGNALGPFAVGTVVKLITEVSNSAGTRTTAVRTITLQTPIV